MGREEHRIRPASRQAGHHVPNGVGDEGVVIEIVPLRLLNLDLEARKLAQHAGQVGGGLLVGEGAGDAPADALCQVPHDVLGTLFGELGGRRVRGAGTGCPDRSGLDGDDHQGEPQSEQPGAKRAKPRGGGWRGHVVPCERRHRLGGRAHASLRVHRATGKDASGNAFRRASPPEAVHHPALLLELAQELVQLRLVQPGQWEV